MKTVSISQATRPLAEYVTGLDEGGVLVTRRGRAVALLIPLKIVPLDEEDIAGRPELASILDKSRKDIEADRFLTLAQMRRLTDPVRPAPKSPRPPHRLKSGVGKRRHSTSH